MYVVVARPVEYDVAQRPAGAIVGLKEVNKKFADDLAKRTRTNLAFYASGQRVAGGVGVEGFDDEKLDAVGNDLKNVVDKTYGDTGRPDVRMFSDDLGAMYARLAGRRVDAGRRFRRRPGARPSLAGPMGFLSTADDKDKANVPWMLLAAVVFGAALIGIMLTVLEHTAPLNELVMQADRLKTGVMDGLQVARFRGAYRLAAQSLNQGMERAIEKAGGVTRKPADLESILGPAPAQPSMSAFSFPMADGAAMPQVPPGRRLRLRRGPTAAAAVPRAGLTPPAPRARGRDASRRRRHPSSCRLSRRAARAYRRRRLGLNRCPLRSSRGRPPPPTSPAFARSPLPRRPSTRRRRGRGRDDGGRRSGRAPRAGHRARTGRPRRRRPSGCPSTRTSFARRSSAAS